MTRSRSTLNPGRTRRWGMGVCLWIGLTVAAFGGGVEKLAAGSRTEPNPPKVRCATATEALQQAVKLAAAIDGTVVQTTGTPSMKPLINGRVFVVIKKHAYDSIQQRQLLVYLGRPDARSTERQSLLHRAVLRDRGGWLMSGDNNARSESWDRVTPQTYVGTVEALFEVAAG
jgi:hypothetical protein